MEKVLIAAMLVLSIWSVPAKSQQSVEIQVSHVCNKTDIVVKFIVEDLKMLPLMGSKIPKSDGEIVMSIWTNDKQKSVVVIMTFNAQEISCFLATGEQFKIYQIY